MLPQALGELFEFLNPRDVQPAHRVSGAIHAFVKHVHEPRPDVQEGGKVRVFHFQANAAGQFNDVRDEWSGVLQCADPQQPTSSLSQPMESFNNIRSVRGICARS